MLIILHFSAANTLIPLSRRRIFECLEQEVYRYRAAMRQHETVPQQVGHGQRAAKDLSKSDLLKVGVVNERLTKAFRMIR